MGHGWVYPYCVGRSSELTRQPILLALLRPSPYFPLLIHNAFTLHIALSCTYPTRLCPTFPLGHLVGILVNYFNERRPLNRSSIFRAHFINKCLRSLKRLVNIFNYSIDPISIKKTINN
jgi:hypothetical protein